MTDTPLYVEDTELGGKAISVYSSIPCNFVFEPVKGEEGMLREDNFETQCVVNGNEANIGHAYGLAVKKLRDLGFRVLHKPHRERWVR